MVDVLSAQRARTRAHECVGIFQNHPGTHSIVWPTPWHQFRLTQMKPGWLSKITRLSGHPFREQRVILWVSARDQKLNLNSQTRL